MNRRSFLIASASAAAGFIAPTLVQVSDRPIPTKVRDLIGGGEPARFGVTPNRLGGEIRLIEVDRAIPWDQYHVATPLADLRKTWLDKQERHKGTGFERPENVAFTISENDIWHLFANTNPNDMAGHFWGQRDIRPLTVVVAPEQKGEVFRRPDGTACTMMEALSLAAQHLQNGNTVVFPHGTQVTVIHAGFGLGQLNDFLASVQMPRIIVETLSYEGDES